jgi:AcrR family transcriptional regulator
LTPDGQSFDDEIAGLLIEASFDLVAKGGWGDFSLRAVADSIGAAGSAASHRFGDRAGLIAAVCEAAIGRERAQMDSFLPGVEVETCEDLTCVLYAWLEERLRKNCKQARNCSELLLVSYRDPAFGSFGARWADLCCQMIARLSPGFPAPGCRALSAFLSVEIAYWLMQAPDPEFRLTGREALGRMVMLGAGAPGPLPVLWMQRALDMPDTRAPLALTGTKLKIVEATAAIIADAGVQALTHREIAKRSGASLSSLTYHFESLDDLIRKGFQQLFTPGSPAPPMPSRAVVAYELALQALRDPLLVPLAAGVRRQMIRGVFEPLADSDPQFLARHEAFGILETASVLAAEPAHTFV